MIGRKYFETAILMVILILQLTFLIISASKFTGLNSSDCILLFQTIIIALGLFFGFYQINYKNNKSKNLELYDKLLKNIDDLSRSLNWQKIELMRLESYYMDKDNYKDNQYVIDMILRKNESDEKVHPYHDFEGNLDYMQKIISDYIYFDPIHLENYEKQLLFLSESNNNAKRIYFNILYSCIYFLSNEKERGVFSSSGILKRIIKVEEIKNEISKVEECHKFMDEKIRGLKKFIKENLR